MRRQVRATDGAHGGCDLEKQSDPNIRIALSHVGGRHPDEVAITDTSDAPMA